MIAQRYSVGADSWAPLAFAPGLTSNATPDVAFNAAGDAIGVFQNSNSIVANYYTAGGVFAGVTGIENSTDTAQEPAIQFDAAGNAIAIWRQQDLSSGYHVWANRYVPGADWLGEVQVENISGDVSAPRIAMDAAGNAIAVWQKVGVNGNNVWSSRFDIASGRWSAAPELLETDDTGGALNADVAADPAGNAIAIWRQFDGARNRVYVNHYNAGVGWSGATALENNTGNARDTAIAMDANGAAVAAWTQDDNNAIHVYARRYTPGNGWDAVRRIDSGTTDARNIRIALDANGAGFAVWEQGGDIWSNRIEP